MFTLLDWIIFGIVLACMSCIDRTVTVYDINGEEVAKYTGRFDVFDV